jgi:transcriptional regulator with XRE-family HTH domain
MVEKLKVRHPEFAARVQKAAENRQLQIRDIQARLKVTYEMARRYWLGVAKPRGTKLAELATFLGMSPAELDYGDDARNTVNRARDAEAVYGLGGLTAEARDVARAWSKLSPLKQQLYRDAIFRDAATESLLPWFRNGRPNKLTYDRFEESVERDYQQHLRQLKLKI